MSREMVIKSEKLKILQDHVCFFGKSGLSKTFRYSNIILKASVAASPALEKANKDLDHSRTTNQDKADLGFATVHPLPQVR